MNYTVELKDQNGSSIATKNSLVEFAKWAIEEYIFPDYINKNEKKITNFEEAQEAWEEICKNDITIFKDPKTPNPAGNYDVKKFLIENSTCQLNFNTDWNIKRANWESLKKYLENDRNDKMIVVVNQSSKKTNSQASNSQTPNQLKLLDGKPLNLIVYGAPGTGKSRQIKDKLNNEIVYRTTFHPDTDYSTFVGCYKPYMQGANIVYGFRRQVFLYAYVEAWKELINYISTNKSGISQTHIQEKEYDSNQQSQQQCKQVFLVIEEINRGNCAQIFGDIFQLLDRNDEGFSEYAIMPDKDIVDELKNETISQAIQEEIKNKCDIYNKSIKNAYYLALPPNLHIWATMNTSDQSLFPMDSAFKRRWEWEYCPIKPDHEKVKDLRLYDGNNWPDVLKKINEQIKKRTKSADKQIGEFFIKSKDGKTIEYEDFRDKVLFYLFNDVFKDDTNFSRVFEEGEIFLFEDLWTMSDSQQQKCISKWIDKLLGKDAQEQSGKEYPSAATNVNDQIATDNE